MRICTWAVYVLATPTPTEAACQEEIDVTGSQLQALQKTNESPCFTHCEERSLDDGTWKAYFSPNTETVCMISCCVGEAYAHAQVTNKAGNGVVEASARHPYFTAEANGTYDSCAMKTTSFFDEFSPCRGSVDFTFERLKMDWLLTSTTPVRGSVSFYIETGKGTMSVSTVDASAAGIEGANKKPRLSAIFQELHNHHVAFELMNDDFFGHTGLLKGSVDFSTGTFSASGWSDKFFYEHTALHGYMTGCDSFVSLLKSNDSSLQSVLLHFWVCLRAGGSCTVPPAFEHVDECSVFGAALFENGTLLGDKPRADMQAKFGTQGGFILVKFDMDDEVIDVLNASIVRNGQRCTLLLGKSSVDTLFWLIFKNAARTLFRYVWDWCVIFCFACLIFMVLCCMGAGFHR